MGVGVAAIGDAVEVDFLCPHLLCHFQHAEPVVSVAVDTAGTHQTHQVDRLAGVDGSLHIVDEDGVFQHFAVLDGLGDEGQLLVHDATGTHIGMTHLRVAHLAVRQADSHTGSFEYP